MDYEHVGLDTIAKLPA